MVAIVAAARARADIGARQRHLAAHAEPAADLGELFGERLVAEHLVDRDLVVERVDVPIGDADGVEEAIAPGGQVGGEVDLSELPQGTYFARITMPNGVVIKKIVKE